MKEGEELTDKMKLFTDSDFDGVSCGILGTLAFEDDIDITYTSPKNIDVKIKKYIESKDYLNYFYTTITDLSVNQENAEKINEIEKSNSCFYLLDHHSTAKELNMYPWCNVELENEKGLTCGTSLFYEHLINSKVLKQQPNLDKFVELARKYDTWIWKKENDLEPKLWNDLMYIIGREDFIKSTIDKIKVSYDWLDFTYEENLLLSYNQKKIDKYIEMKAKNIISMNVFDYNAGVVFAEQVLSELGDKLGEMFPEFDLIAMINMGTQTISYRTQRDNVNLGDIAKKLGGGGHQKAAGSPINNIEDFLKRIF